MHCGCGDVPPSRLFQSDSPYQGRTVLVAKLGLYLAAGGAEGNEKTAGEGLARPDSNGFLVAVTRGTRAGEIVRTEEASMRSRSDPYHGKWLL